MGKATRWLRGLLGGKKESVGKEKPRLGCQESHGKEKRRKEMDAHGAMRLRRSGRRSMCVEGIDFWAAVKIQAVFRGFLARKALRALRALVKLQALVRGFLVRKQAAAALHSMQALIRAQAIVLNRRGRVLPIKDHSRFHPEFNARRCLERCDGVYDSRKMMEMDMNMPRWRNRRSTTPCCCSSDEQPAPSPRTPHIPPRISLHKSRDPHPQCCCPLHEDCLSSITQATPRFHDTSLPGTPSRSASRGPSYMASTQSFTAKLRSLSAPRQRPESPRARGASGEAVAAEEERRRRSCSQAPHWIDPTDRCGCGSGRRDENEMASYCRQPKRRW